jgi:hypothetical protein
MDKIMELYDSSSLEKSFYETIKIESHLVEIKETINNIRSDYQANVVCLNEANKRLRKRAAEAKKK